jgi:hypothetical protein
MAPTAASTASTAPITPTVRELTTVPPVFDDDAADVALVEELFDGIDELLAGNLEQSGRASDINGLKGIRCWCHGVNDASATSFAMSISKGFGTTRTRQFSAPATISGAPKAVIMITMVSGASPRIVSSRCRSFESGGVIKHD